ncbi:TetR/AcrR family transcriptional regulator [Paraburkholderia sp. B3]|uniref:TetR/AcrR family transcriptional regulator n=1 Tax=Paraburkholderia sp. B3 TaxID=3134791 RepID=UPI003981BFC1
MPAIPTSKDEIVDRLFTVFRDQGFDGTSISDLSRATGLGKSSLYHHFPDGKEQMAEAVLDRAKILIDRELLDAACSPSPLKPRVRKIVAALDHMYAGGRASCVLGQMTTSAIGPEARRGLQDAFTHWIEAIEKLAADSGLSASRARHFAEDWVARLQGALIIQAASGNTGPYKRTLQALLDLAKDDTV